MVITDGGLRERATGDIHSRRVSITATFAAALAVFVIWSNSAAAQVSSVTQPASFPPAGLVSVGASRPVSNSAQSPFGGSVPQPLVPGTLGLTVSDAIDRALRYNLGIVTFAEELQGAHAARWRALTGLLPTVNARASETNEKVSLAAFGFNGSLVPGIPPVIGPFRVFDARVSAIQPVLDISAVQSVRREDRNVDAATLESRNAREVVVLVVTNLYLQALAASSHIDAIRAQVQTADALFVLATDLRQAGISAQIDVVRAQVELESQRQGLIAAENEFQKQKLQLARAIGLPVSQSFDLTDTIPYAAERSMATEEALTRAYEGRTDYRAALARVQAAEADRRSASAEALPSIVVNADYGAIGPSISDAKATFSVVGAVQVPVFDGGRRRGRLIETDSILRERRAEAEDFRERVASEVRMALLDVQATEAQLRVAQGVVDLANTQLTQAQDRFKAGVTNNLEVVQAQEAVASATNSQINSLYAYNLAKASLARAMGVAEATAKSRPGPSP
jgi:outer membrane protein TolC